jgi:hypothetical protein
LLRKNGKKMSKVKMPGRKLLGLIILGIFCASKVSARHGRRQVNLDSLQTVDSDHRLSEHVLGKKKSLFGENKYKPISREDLIGFYARIG